MASLIAIPDCPVYPASLPVLPYPRGLFARACDAIGAPNLHHNLSERFLVETDSDHKYLGLKTDELCTQMLMRNPTGPRRFPLFIFFIPELLVVPGLRNGCIRLVTARGTYTFVFVVDTGGSL